MIKRLMIVIIGLFLVATPTFALSTTDLWSYYDMETGGNTPDDITGNGRDLSGTSLGTRPSVNTNGIYGSALEYGGSTSSNIAYYPTSWTGTKYSLSGWVKGDAGSFSSLIFPAIAVSGQYSSGGTWMGFGGSSGNTDFVRVHLGSTSATDSSAGTISEGVWQHLVITYDSVSNEVKVYVEGSLVHTYTSSVNAITSTAREFAIGARDGGTGSIQNEFDGLLDEIAWFDGRILTASEVSELYNDGYGLFYNSTSGAFDIDPKTLASGLTNYYSLEESGFNYLDSHGSADFTSGTAPTRITGKIAYGQDFQSDSIETSGTNWGTPQTYAFWVDPDVINNGYYFSDSNPGTPIQVYNDGSNRLTYYDGTNILSSNPNVLSTSGGWQHVVIVLDGGSSAIYIDGSAVGLNTNSVSTTPTMSGDVYMGSYKTGGINLDAGLDEFGVWSRPLSSSEVTELYNGGSGLSYNDINPTTLETDLERYYTFDSTNNDEQGNYNAVDVGSISYDTGNAKIGSASLLYNGQTEGKQVGGLNTDIHGGTKEFTYNFWVELDSVNLAASYDDWIINDWMPMATSQSDFLIAVRNGNWGILGSDNTGVAALQLDGDSASTNWDMITVFRNSTHIGISVNGGTPVTQAYTNTIDTNIANAGLGTSSAYNLLGNLDEVGMWTRALNSTEIDCLYNSGSGLAYSDFSTCGAASNTNPTITPIADQSMNEDTTLNVTSAFTIGDAEDPISGLTLSYTSSDTSLINSTGSITFNVNTTTGVVDMLDITPNANAFGTSTIDVTVTDTGSLTNSSSFLLTVFSVNDAPTITPIADQTTTEGATLVINFNVTDVDNPYTDLTYTATAGDVSLIDSATFSNYDGTNQTLTLVAGDYGVTDINVTVQDLQPAQASTQFQYLVNCNTTANYYTPMNVTMQINQGTTDPVVCLSQTFNYNVGSDILTYQWYDFGATMTDIELYVYDSTGGFRRLLNQTTLSTDNGTQTFDYSAINPHYDLLVIAELTDGTRNFGGSTPSEARILESTVNQKGQLGSLFSDADGIIYGVLILLLFLTIGIASQSATLTLIFSVLGLFIASKFVLKIPSEFIWITGALVVILLYLIAKLRTD